MSDYTLQLIGDRHLTDIVRIEQTVHIAPWSKTQLTPAQGRFDHHYALISQDAQIIGYFYARCIAGEAELLNLAVDRTFQGKGVGHQLLTLLKKTLVAAGAKTLWLEVRQSNRGARALYQKQGFELISRRAGYYSCPDGTTEDALVMRYQISSSHVL
ncbi:ribosomal protein S18-alanine N-acetyltransferase [Salinivibrio sp. ML290]|uniref:ribosomal protein S18-alanine N-acetyltransferase n=1 Tax=Salinivibrio sp. ML290 TaxID=1909468 RepID=UPI0009884DEB|nr:ribosomal protein S18-alanine N-acetyltransferase [Salinivibrio sp. ML290]OOE75219.1 ribosomal-protein-alanine N-acetyltransferase [Salinivibrio sp. ML290]